MRRTRFMTWFFVVLSLAFFCLRDFRVAWESPLVALLPYAWTGGFGSARAALSSEEELYWLYKPRAWPVRLLRLGTARILERLYTLERYVTPEQLRQLAYEAEQKGDSELMAFAVLHLPAKEMREDILRLTDRAVARDSKLTWLVSFVVCRYNEEWGAEPFAASLRARVDKLQTWDPDNAVPYLLRAAMIRSSRQKDWDAAGTDRSKILKVLAQDLAWQKEMAAAFRRPHFDPYTHRLLDLEREVMLQRGWNNPVVVGFVLCSFPSPALRNAWDYAKLVVRDIGADAEATGRMEKALEGYWRVGRFAERVRLQSQDTLDNILGVAMQFDAYNQLVPALKKAGKKDEAEAVDFARQQWRTDYAREHMNSLARTSNLAWSALLVNLSAGLAWVFLVLALSCLVYVNVKLVFRKEKKGRVYQFMTVGENYFPIMLFVACLGLYLSYMPYAQNFSYYMTTEEPLYGADRVLMNSSPIGALYELRSVPLTNPFGAYAAYALAGIALLVLVSLLARRWDTRKTALPHGADSSVDH